MLRRGSKAVGIRGAVVTAATLVSAACAPSPEERRAEQTAVVERYCVDCHDDAERTAGLSFESVRLSAVAEHPDVFEKAVRKLKAGLMPPPEGAVPDKRARAELVSWLEETLDAAAAASPNPGRTETFHRLNRREYGNTIRDLFAVDVDVSELLPGDDSSYGFDNIAGVLKLSPLLLERYLAAADEVARLAVGLPAPFVDVDYFRVPDDLSQESRLPGQPFGTRGGMTVDYTFPVDAEYTIAVELSRDLNEGVPLYAEEQLLEVAIDGARAALYSLPAVPVAPARGAGPASASNDPSRPAISQIRTTLRLGGAERAARNRIDADWRVRVPVKAGVHRVTIAFLESTHALNETPRLPFLRPYPAGVNIPETRTGAYLRSLEIAGPYDAKGPGDTPSRRAIFVCRPESFAGGADEACAERILGALARRAFRRPVTSDEIAPLLAFYRDGRDGPEAGVDATDDERFDAGIRLALKRLLVAPEFLFRVEREPAGLVPGQSYALDDFALASRLSFFLWSSIPDEELLALAERGELGEADVLSRQVRRMLADERSAAFVEGFAGQWLYLRNLEAAIPVQNKFPDFDDSLRQSLKRETELFVASIVREDRSALDLLRADYTFLNERVARHYGIPGVKGPHFRRVELPDGSPRRGLLGHGSILTVTSYPDRTSPVVRGKWILENLLGAAPPPPPPNVPELEATNGAGETLAMRERLAAHRADPACSGCHAVMDPLGFALENFDAIGRFRTLDETGTAIDAAGTLPDGTPFESVDELRAALLDSELFVTTLTEKLLIFALGRGLEHYDMPAVRGIVRDAVRDDYRFAALVEGVVTSTPFRMRRAGP